MRGRIRDLLLRLLSGIHVIDYLKHCESDSCLPWTHCCLYKNVPLPGSIAERMLDACLVRAA